MAPTLLVWPPGLPVAEWRYNVLRRQRYCKDLTKCAHTDIRCCCNTPVVCCICEWLDNWWVGINDLKVVFSGAFTGTCALRVAEIPEFGCSEWSMDSTDLAACITDTCSLNFDNFYFWCIDPADPDFPGYKASIGVANIGCFPDPTIVSETASTCPADPILGPPEDFMIQFDWTLKEDVPGRCCGFTSIRAVITAPGTIFSTSLDLPDNVFNWLNN